MFGSLITGFALPLVAILTLQASPFQVGLLAVAELAPGMLLGLFAGAWVDRLRRKPLMILADLGRAALLGSVPAAYAFGALGIAQLYGVALCVSVLNVLFDVSYVSYLPSIVGRDHLIEGNSKLEATNSVRGGGGASGWRALAGAGIMGKDVPEDRAFDLHRAVGDPRSWMPFDLRCLRSIARPDPHTRTTNLESDIPQGGLQHRSARNPRGGTSRDRRWTANCLGYTNILRALAAASATMEFFAHIFVAVLLLYLTKDLGLEPAVFGLVFAIGARVEGTISKRVRRCAFR